MFRIDEKEIVSILNSLGLSEVLVAVMKLYRKPFTYCLLSSSRICCPIDSEFFVYEH